MTKDNSSKAQLSGQRLVADYQSAMIAIATSQVAKTEAERSESELLGTLVATGSSGGLLNPNNITQGDMDKAARASLDAHIKKVQADQIEALSREQLEVVASEDGGLYKGKKVKITSLSKNFQPFDAIWFNQQTGYRNHEYKKRSLSGFIEELSFDKNLLVVKPGFFRRLLVNDLKFFMVYVINPNTLEPAVAIEII